MRVSHRETPRREALNIRIKPQVRELIDRAAELAGKNRSEFVLDAARRAAEGTRWHRSYRFCGESHSLSSVPGAPRCSATAE